MSGYIYVALWAFLAIYLLYMGVKQKDIILYITSGMFCFLTVWYLINEIIAVNLFLGVIGWIFRGVVIAFAIVLVLLLILRRRKIKNSGMIDAEAREINNDK